MTLAVLSNNFVYAATAVYALAMLAHAAEWAFAREHRTAPAAREQSAAEPARASAMVGAGRGAPVRPPRAAPADRPTSGPPSGGRASGGESDRTRQRIAQFTRIGVALTVLATLLVGAGVVSRGFAAGRVPWSNLYAFAITGVFAASAVYLLLLRRYRLSWLGLPLTGLMVLLLGVAITLLYEPVVGLIPALQSYWLAIHVTAAILGSALLTVGALTSVLQLLRSRAEHRALGSDGAAGRPVPGYLRRLPSAEAIDRVAYRLHAFAFPIWTFALMAGAIWASRAWGRYWGWDPKETWMLITWVCYAAYLHSRATAGWRSKSPWIALVGYGALMFNLVGVNVFLTGLHSYAGV